MAGELGRMQAFADWLVSNGWLPNDTDTSGLIERFLYAKPDSLPSERTSIAMRAYWKAKKTLKAKERA